jgi:hypothetical protein
MNALSKTEDQVVLSNALQPFVDALADGEVELDRRRYAAIALSGVVYKLQRVDLLRPRIADLLSATFNDPDEQVRELASARNGKRNGRVQRSDRSRGQPPATMTATSTLTGRL